jgi:hypothetical protein
VPEDANALALLDQIQNSGRVLSKLGKTDRLHITYLPEQLSRWYTSGFGDEEYGKKIVSLRERAWEMLRRLDHIYRTQGPEQLMEALKQPLERHDALHLIPEGLLSVANQSGSAGAEEMIQRKLTAATSHQKEMIKTR